MNSRGTPPQAGTHQRGSRSPPADGARPCRQRRQHSPPQPATDNAVTADAAPLWDENGYIVASNQQDLDAAIAKAREAGVTVTTSEQKLDAVASNDAEQAKTRIEQSNAEAIKALNTAVTKQQEYNLAFETKLKEELKKVLEVESNKGLVLGDEVDWDSLSVITPATKERDENHKFALNSDGRDLITAKKVTVGQSWSYSNVFQNAHEGSWVDLRLTLMSAASHNNDGTVREVDEVPLNGVMIDKRSVAFETLKYDVTIKVDFLSNGKPVEVTPLLIFTDVDEGQAVNIDSDNLIKAYAGSSVTIGEKSANRGSKNSIYSSDHISAAPSNRPFWAAFALRPTSSFTYTYFDGTSSGSLHGIGGSTLAFDRPSKSFVDPVEVTIQSQQVKHQVDYKIVGDAPTTSDELPAVSTYAHNAGVTIADGLSTESTDKDGTPGTWTFNGWYTTSDLNTKAQSFTITQDTTLYGAWEFTPNTYKVTHEFVSGTKGMDLPDEITKRTPANQEGILNGTTVNPGTFDATDYVDEANDGTWTFQAWDATEQTINKTDAHFIGTWIFTASTKPVPAPTDQPTATSKPTAGPTSTVTPTPSAKPVVKRSLTKTGTSTALALSAAGSALLAGALLLSRRRSRS
ncbi:MAG: LPXTG cell wall anchor domain-containing protein [Actinomyces urogenitalis]|uniref:SHIRT domain-containing protein n=1 Tax=Actinomyces urogenitalis TaxID=103621 RepID=UPI0024301217|nr:SHIRT domain-containing protein [Actinomyces urogenitalis]MBS5976330.1 LPXTG cell wall anchor domain-containing protein [Actinomyces urogenitalis]